jgi:hypothetical protein
MASVTLEGELEIDRADVWQGLDEAGQPKSHDFKEMRFSRDDDALVLVKAVEEVDQAPVYVDAADFWRWVIDKQLPDGVRGFETVFGIPTVSESYSLNVTFAASNESDPRGWAKAPACMAEWKS